MNAATMAKNKMSMYANPSDIPAPLKPLVAPANELTDVTR
jgi:hypothetical protein